MRRASHLLALYETLYRCTECGFIEASEDLPLDLMMKGGEPRCSRCGDVAEAFWGYDTFFTKKTTNVTS
jgi:DNA-directed RNA polymerase subunit RPC12/RpoP